MSEKRFDVYFAAPLFSQAERDFNVKHVSRLENDGHSVFLPQRDGNESINWEQERMSKLFNIFKVDRDAILDSRMMVAILDGTDVDSGVAVECGIAWENNIPVLGVHTDERVFSDKEKINAMIFGTLLNQDSITMPEPGVVQYDEKNLNFIEDASLIPESVDAILSD